MANIPFVSFPQIQVLLIFPCYNVSAFLKKMILLHKDCAILHQVAKPRQVPSAWNKILHYFYYVLTIHLYIYLSLNNTVYS